jgi:glycosyltransferase involved in cell wall biosynthesis
MSPSRTSSPGTPEKIRILYGLEAAEGGALKHVAYLALHLDKRLFDITVILSTRRDRRVCSEMDRLRAAGVTVIDMPMERQVKPGKDLAALLTLYKHLGRCRYDVVHAHSSKAGVLFRIAAWLRGIPTVVYTPHCFYFQGQSGIRQGMYLAIEQLMGFLTDRIVVSNNEKNSAIRFRVAPPRKLVNINNAIDFSEYEPAEKSKVRRELGIADDAVVVGAIGRLVEQKDWLTYIYAARETLQAYPNAVFLLSGEGALRAKLTQTIQELGLAQQMIITPHYEEISKIYSAIDIFVSTSLWEGLPYVLLEAMWFKKPVIATDLGYGTMITDQQNGYLVGVKDYCMIADKIKGLLADKALRLRMGEKGNCLVKDHFPFRKFLQQHEGLYRKAVGKFRDER